MYSIGTPGGSGVPGTVSLLLDPPSRPPSRPHHPGYLEPQDQGRRGADVPLRELEQHQEEDQRPELEPELGPEPKMAKLGVLDL